MNVKKKRYFIMTICCMALLLGCGGLRANAARTDRRDEDRHRGWRPNQETEAEQPEEESGLKGKGKTPEKSEFGSVPYFRDDSGSNTQLVDGWIYGYWSRMLCRVHPETLKTQVLFEALSPQSGAFCVYNGYVYFLEQPNISYVDGAKANLRRVKCDGSKQEMLVENFTVAEYWDYNIYIYDGILYLHCPYGEKEDYRFFRLAESGEVQEISIEETLYGMLPEKYTDACQNYRYCDMPNLVYCMAHFGYAFICDEAGRLYRVKPETGKVEEIPLPELNTFDRLTLTNDALIYVQNGDTWYSVSLDDVEEITEIGELEGYGMSFWDEKGIYYVDRDYGEGSFSIERLNWNGEKEILDYWYRNPRLSTSVYGDYLNVIFSDGTYLYYDTLVEGDGAIYRTPLEGDKREAEQVFVYYDNPVKSISTRETFDTTFTVEDTGEQSCFSMTKLYLTEETEAAKKINSFLEEMYSDEGAYMEELMDDTREMAYSEWKSSDWAWSYTLVEETLGVSIDYIDDNYIGISSYWYEYRNGAAHGMHGNVEYVFSRSSGELLKITDVVKNSEAEICAIIAPYVEAYAEWGTVEEGWESIILEDGRFFLTTEGIGIHFDVYELTCYAAGDLDIVVPYEKFEMKNPGETGQLHL